MVDTKLTIDYEGKPADVEFKELTYGEMKDILKTLGLSKGKITAGGIELPELDWTVLFDQLLTKSIVKAPFPVTADGLSGLSPSIVNSLIKKALEVNPFQFGL